MLTDPSIEQRLAAVEKAIAELQLQLRNGTPTVNWLERFTGSFKDEPAFAEVVAFGREIRAADWPPEGPTP